MAYVWLGSVPNRAVIAREVAGEASFQAICHLHQFQTGTRFEAWLQQIVCNAIRNHFRREQQTLPPWLYRVKADVKMPKKPE